MQMNSGGFIELLWLKLSYAFGLRFRKRHSAWQSNYLIRPYLINRLAGKRSRQTRYVVILVPKLSDLP